jgi:hypothetical protein
MAVSVVLGKNLRTDDGGVATAMRDRSGAWEVLAILTTSTPSKR